MPNHKPSERASNVIYKVKETNKSDILLDKLVLDIMKWLKRWKVKDLSKLSSDTMKYMFIEDRSINALRMQWQDAKMSNLEYDTTNPTLLPHEPWFLENPNISSNSPVQARYWCNIMSSSVKCEYMQMKT